MALAGLDRRTEDLLVDAAVRARKRAYAPYSKFKVGAALLCEDSAGDDVVVIGCNVENASYGLCICAERTAVSTAIAQGHTKMRAIAVATGSSPPSPPCGMCRQVLREMAEDMPIVLVGAKGKRLRTTLARIFPGGFTGALLSAGRGR